MKYFACTMGRRFACALSVALVACGGGGGAGEVEDEVLGPTPGASQAFHADTPFSQYRPGLTLQALGGYPELIAISDSVGLIGSSPVLGSPLRFGKVDDPKGKLIKGVVRKVLRLAMRDDDPATAGSTAIRVDAVLPNGSVDKDTTYWTAFEVYVPSNTYGADDYTTLVNVHPNDSEPKGNWAFALERGQFSYVRSDPNNRLNTYVRISATDAPPDTWLKVIVKFRLSNSSAGLNQTWINKGSGLVQVVNDSGANSPVTGGDYMKMAFYNYSWLANYGDHARPQRELFYRSVLSPIKDVGQTAAQIAALLV